MMNDIVERLRKYPHRMNCKVILWNQECDCHRKDCREAADEIERLKAVMDAAQQKVHVNTDTKPTIHELETILDDECAVTILPNGEPRAGTGPTQLAADLDLCEETAKALMEMIGRARKALLDQSVDTRDAEYDHKTVGDAIDEIERLTGEVDSYRTDYEECYNDLLSETLRANTAEAQIAKLQEQNDE
jgi:hypothetical protein